MLRKLDVKKAKTRGLIAKIVYMKRALWAIFMDFAMGIVTQGILEGILKFIKLDFSCLKGQFDVKKNNFRD